MYIRRILFGDLCCTVCVCVCVCVCSIVYTCMRVYVFEFMCSHGQVDVDEGLARCCRSVVQQNTLSLQLLQSAASSRLSLLEVHKKITTQNPLSKN